MLIGDAITVRSFSIIYGVIRTFLLIAYYFRCTIAILLKPIFRNSGYLFSYDFVAIMTLLLGCGAGAGFFKVCVCASFDQYAPDLQY